MRGGEELRLLANSIIDAYEMRVKAVNTLMNQTNHLLKTFQTELEEMIAQLKSNLARSESLRKKDFDLMMEDVSERRRRRQKETEQSLRLFQKEESTMIINLRNMVSAGTGSKLKGIEAIREDIHQRQKEREKTVIKALKHFQVEQGELKTALKSLLSKGENVKIKDFRIMLKALKVQQSDHDEDVLMMLEDFDIVRDKIQTQWQAVLRASS